MITMKQVFRGHLFCKTTIQCHNSSLFILHKLLFEDNLFWNTTFCCQKRWSLKTSCQKGWPLKTVWLKKGRVS